MPTLGWEYVHSFGRSAGEALENIVGKIVSSTMDREIRRNHNAVAITAAGFPPSSLLGYVTRPFRSNRIGRVFNRDWEVLHVSETPLNDAASVVHRALQITYAEGDRVQLERSFRTRSASLSADASGKLTANGVPVAEAQAAAQAAGETYLGSSIFYESQRPPTSTLDQKLADIRNVSKRNHLVLLEQAQRFSGGSLINLTTILGPPQQQFGLVLLGDSTLQTTGLARIFSLKMDSDPPTVSLIYQLFSRKYPNVTRDAIDTMISTAGVSPYRLRLIMETVMGYHKMVGHRRLIDRSFVSEALVAAGNNVFD